VENSVTALPCEKFADFILTKRWSFQILNDFLRTNSQPVVVTQPDERHANRTASVLVVWQTQSIQHLVQTKKNCLIRVVFPLSLKF